MIPPQGSADFAAAMEKVLDVYRRPYDAAFPVVCMDETPRQLIGETRAPVPAAPGRPAREDYEYRRCGTCNVFMATQPLAGRRMTKVTARRTKTDWAHFLNDIAARLPGAKRITLVMDNLNTHRPGALYEAFPPAEAKALWDRFEFVYTPKHGSWLNVAEVELSVMIRQCLNRRIDSIDILRDEVAAWQASRDRLHAKVNWQFTTDDARIKLKRLYPTLDEWHDTSVFRPKRNDERRAATRFSRDGSPAEPPPGELGRAGFITGCLAGMDRRPNAARVSSQAVWPGWIAGRTPRGFHYRLFGRDGSPAEPPPGELGRVGFTTGCQGASTMTKVRCHSPGLAARTIQIGNVSPASMPETASRRSPTFPMGWPATSVITKPG